MLRIASAHSVSTSYQLVTVVRSSTGTQHSGQLGTGRGMVWKEGLTAESPLRRLLGLVRQHKGARPLIGVCSPLSESTTQSGAAAGLTHNKSAPSAS